jgi:hypothetical protein
MFKQLISVLVGHGWRLRSPLGWRSALATAVRLGWRWGIQTKEIVGTHL